MLTPRCLPYWWPTTILTLCPVPSSSPYVSRQCCVAAASSLAPSFPHGFLAWLHLVRRTWATHTPWTLKDILALTHYTPFASHTTTAMMIQSCKSLTSQDREIHIPSEWDVSSYEHVALWHHCVAHLSSLLRRRMLQKAIMFSPIYCLHGISTEQKAIIKHRSGLDAVWSSAFS